MTIPFLDVFDGDERKEIFTGDMSDVPSEEREFSTWLTVITYFNEEESSRIYADVVYLANPQIRVTVRVKAMVREVKLGSSR